MTKRPVLALLILALVAVFTLTAIKCPDNSEPKPTIKVEICTSQGLIPNQWCPDETKEIREYYVGEQPTEICTFHKKPELPYTECKYPVGETEVIRGWSWAYEGGVIFDNGEIFNAELRSQVAEEMAKYVNAIRFFTYCTEDAWWLKNTYIPFKKVNNKYDCTKLSDFYVAEVTARLDEYHKRKLTTILCLFTSIKGQRFQFCPLNGNRNTNGTITDHSAFMKDEKTMAVAAKYIRNMVRTFDNEYVIWELINEPFAFKRGELEKWNKRMIRVLTEEGVPANRIMVEFMGVLGSAIYQFLEAGHWVATHSVNSFETVKRYHSTNERWGLREDRETGRKNKTIGCGDGGDEFGARGLAIWGSSGKNRKASSGQMYQMLLFDLANGKIPTKWFLTSGHGIDFMSNAAFAFPFEQYYVNLKDAIRIAIEGLTQEECNELGVDFEENRMPELKAIYWGFQDSRSIENN